MSRLLLRSLSALVLVFGSLVAMPSHAADAKKLNFDQHVMPLIQDKCLVCHNGDKAKGGLDMSTFTGLMEGGASGVVIRPGDADKSRMYTMTAHKEAPYMPPKSPMIAIESVNLLRDWINGGALQNAGSKVAPVKPKVDVSLKSVTRGKPEGPPPMPPATLNRATLVSTPKANSVIALAAAPWSPLIAVGGQKQVLLYHSETLELLGILPFTHGTPTVLKFSRNGSLLMVGGGRGGKSGKVVVFDIRSGESIIEVGNETDAVLAADISADQSKIALGGPSKLIRIYSTKDGSLVREVKKHTDWIYAIEFSPDAVLLATADRSGGLFVWEAETGREFYSLRGHTAGITDVAWRDDSNVLASASEDTTIRLWEMENGTQTKSWAGHVGGSLSVRWSHDNRLVTTGRDRISKLWDANGAMQKQFEPHPDLALRAAISHDNLRVMSGDWTGQTKVFMVADGKATGAVSTNPPTPAERLAAATKRAADAQIVLDGATAGYNALTANLAKANADLAAAQKAVVDLVATIKTQTDLSVAAKANLDRETAAKVANDSKFGAVTLRATTLAEAHAKLQKAADDSKGNPSFVAGAVEVKAVLDKALAELALVKIEVARLTGVVATLTAAYAEAVKPLAAHPAMTKAAADAVPPKVAAIAPVQAQVAAGKVNLDKATADLAAAKADLEKAKVVPVAVPAPVAPAVPPAVVVPPVPPKK